MATVTETAKAVRECAEPLRAAVEETIRDTRRAAVAGRHAVEDATAAATLKVRRHPLASVGFALGVGTLLGCLIGFNIARRKQSNAN